MEPGRSNSRQPVHKARTQRRAAGGALVRAPRVFPLGSKIMGAMALWTTRSNDSFVANRAANDRTRQMNLPEYYKKPLWCRVLRHLIPMTVAACIGALAIMFMD